MSEENSYDHESVQELLTWAKDTLSNKSYPAGEYQINKSTKTYDCGKYLESMIAVISRNWENSTFYPTIDQLRAFIEKLKEVAE